MVPGGPARSGMGIAKHAPETRQVLPFPVPSGVVGATQNVRPRRSRCRLPLVLRRAVEIRNCLLMEMASPATAKGSARLLEVCRSAEGLLRTNIALQGIRGGAPARPTIHSIPAGHSCTVHIRCLPLRHTREFRSCGRFDSCFTCRPASSSQSPRPARDSPRVAPRQRIRRGRRQSPIPARPHDRARSSRRATRR